MAGLTIAELNDIITRLGGDDQRFQLGRCPMYESYMEKLKGERDRLITEITLDKLAA